MALLFGALNANAFYGQSLNFQHYSTDNGLPQSTVYDIVQDSDGFIWFGTEAGIGRFDGLKVKTYSLADGLAGNNVPSLFIDSHKSLWIGTNGGISILYENEIKNFTTANGLSDDLAALVETIPWRVLFRPPSDRPARGDSGRLDYAGLARCSG